MRKKILACATHSGSVNAIKSVTKEFISRGYEVDVRATGNEDQARNFQGFTHYKYGNLNREECDYLIKNSDMVLVGMSGANTPDIFMLESASKYKIPSVAVIDLDTSYQEKLGSNPDYFPTILSVSNKKCLETIRNSFPDRPEIAEELIKRTRITGWTIFEYLAELRENFSEKSREEFLHKIGLNPDENYHVHFTQNLDPETEYLKRHINSSQELYEKWSKIFNYETGTTRRIFEIAFDIGLKNIIVKPHPGEKTKHQHTLNLARKYGFTYLPGFAFLDDSVSVPENKIDNKLLMLSAKSLSAGRTTCLDEACILDKNIGGLFPELGTKDVAEYSSVTNCAIPYTFEWDGVGAILFNINSTDEYINNEMRERRKRFSVDGKASKRLVDIIEEEIF